MLRVRSTRSARRALLTLLLLAAASASARVFVVDADHDAADRQVGDGVCVDASGACTLRAAIQEANASTGLDEIWLQPWSEAEPIQYRIDIISTDAGEDHAARGDLDIRDSLLLRRHPAHSSGLVNVIGFVPTPGGSPGDRIFDIHLPAADMSVQFSDLTIANGILPDPSADGAGMRIGATSSVELRRVVFYANFGHGYGTALSVRGRASLLDGVVFDNHQTRESLAEVAGGAIHVAEGGWLDLDNALLTDNSVWRGGALLVEGAGARARVTRSFLRNPVDIVVSAGAAVQVENATLAGVAQVRADTGGRIDLAHSTFSRGLLNVSMASGALFADASGAHISLANSVIEAAAMGLPAPCSAPAGAISSRGGNVYARGAPCAIALQNTDRVVDQLRLIALRAAPPIAGMPGTFHYAMAPLPGSAVIAAADPTFCPPLDQLGTPRPGPASGMACASGAIEGPRAELFVDGFELTF